METPDQSRSKSKTAVNWPSQVSYYLLGMLTSTHKDGKSGDNGLRREQWKCIADALNEQWKTSYDWEQTRNHYRVWKARLKYLVELQRDSGMGWNEHENRFCAGPHRWADMQKTEQRYWKDHPVLPIHVETLLWLGNEIATGDHALHPCEIPNESEQEGFTAEVPIHDGMNEDGADGSPLASELPSNQTVCSSRRRGRPHANSTSEQPKKKKKGIAEKVTSPLKEMANALKIMATADTEMDFAKLVNAAVKEMDGYDKQQKVRARRYLLHHKMEAKSILSAPKTERVEMLEEYMDEESSP